MRQREDGYTVLITKDNSEYRLPLSEHDRALAAWKKGEAFLETVDFYGAQRTIKLGPIESIGAWTPEHIAALREDTAASRAEDAIRGEG